MKTLLRRNWVELTFGGAVLVILLIVLILRMHLHVENQQHNTDVNRDGLTNEMDYKLLMDKYGTPCSNCNEDINNDGLIDGKDILILLSEYDNRKAG